MSRTFFCEDSSVQYRKINMCINEFDGCRGRTGNTITYFDLRPPSTALCLVKTNIAVFIAGHTQLIYTLIMCYLWLGLLEGFSVYIYDPSMFIYKEECKRRSI